MCECHITERRWLRFRKCLSIIFPSKYLFVCIEHPIKEHLLRFFKNNNEINVVESVSTFNLNVIYISVIVLYVSKSIACLVLSTYSFFFMNYVNERKFQIYLVVL